MKLSTERILTTHVGSLARPPDLFDMIAARSSGQPYDTAAFDARVRQAVADVVRRQAELGIDIIDDGEQGKIIIGGSFADKAVFARARAVGVRGVIVGGIDDADLRELLGYTWGWRSPAVSRSGSR